jgi:hypothetical protein
VTKDSQSHPDKTGPGWETTYGAFVDLLGEIHGRVVVAPLLRDWFGYEIIGPEKAPELRAPSGDLMPLHVVHDRIQADPELRYTFYQHRMARAHWDSFAHQRWEEHLAAQARAAPRPVPWWRRLFGKP